MALPILDGNQSATTLSTILSGGEHTPAHTVVSLGSTAISNITSAVSGSVVSVSNFPATQTIAGTVTANVADVVGESGFSPPLKGVQLGYFNETEGEFRFVSNTNNPLPISGTVTANVPLVSNTPVNQMQALPVVLITDEGTGAYDTGQQLPVEIKTIATSVTIGSLPAISGTVTVGNSVTIGSLPTLTPQLPRVTFIDGSGTVVTANSAVTLFASSSTRSYLLVQVTTGSAFVNVGATATTVNGISLTAGQGYAWETTIPQGAVSLISTTTNSAYVAKQA